MARKRKDDKKNANGEGSVFKSRDRFRWQLSVPTRDGRPPIRIGGTCVTREEAELKLIQARADHSRGVLALSTGSKITFRAYAEEYMRRPHGWAETTARRYQILLDYANEVIGDTALRDLKPVHIRKFLAELSGRKSQSTRNKGEVVGYQTVNTALWLVRSVLQDAVVDELLRANPTVNIHLPRPGREDALESLEARRVYDRDEAARFCAVGKGLYEAGLCDHWPALYTILSLGLRRGEAAALRWQDIDFARNLLLVRQSRNYQSKITAPKTKSSVRDLPMPPSVRDMIDAQDKGAIGPFARGRRYVDPNLFTQAMKSVQRWSDPARLDANLRGVAFRGADLSPEFLDLLESGARLPDMNVHGLRHTFATLALRSGVPIEVVSKTLGHARISMTLDTYRHVLESEHRERTIDLFASQNS